MPEVPLLDRPHDDRIAATVSADEREAAVSVIMTLRANGDAKELERRAAANPQAMRKIADQAEKHGLIAHRFYGSDNGQIMVIDEWPDAESFQRFFEEMRTEIDPLMREVGVTSEPEVTFWRKLESHDEVGWNH